MTPAPSRREYCHNCGEAQSDDANFCAQCGASQDDNTEIDDAPEPAPPPAGDHARKPDHSASVDNVQRAALLVPHPPFRSGTRAHGRRAALLPWVITAAWVGLVSWYLYASWPGLLKLGAYGVGDLLLRAIVPLALFWLAVGYFQLAGRLRQPEALSFQAAQLAVKNEESATLVAELLERSGAAVRLVEVELEKLREYDKARLRTVQPRWEIHGRIAHEQAYEINLRNAGAAASGLSASWDKSLPMAVILSDTGVIDRAGYLTLKVMFLENRLDDFAVKLHYRDGANEERVALIVVSNLDATLRQEEI